MVYSFHMTTFFSIECITFALLCGDICVILWLSTWFFINYCLKSLSSEVSAQKWQNSVSPWMKS